MLFQDLDDVDEIIHKQNEITLLRNEFEKEMHILRNEITLLKNDLNKEKTNFSYFIHTLNVQLTDLHGKIEHIEKYGDKSREKQRKKVILCNYFESLENK